MPKGKATERRKLNSDQSHKQWADKHIDYIKREGIRKVGGKR